ncbi:hypothetical protein R69619_05149 [Paraburkholderia nemoris]|uniref:hypothetical protein n=1 Tax=Paraburkholderia nemoris TaxID=2793076 RepID=UPI001B1931DE|nr:hypothetical protein [Paraburkholderia nemoris]CAE6799965.1 hypothetical protein R69619_05149 [Paraburkholderia nemoris]
MTSELLDSPRFFDELKIAQRFSFQAEDLLFHRLLGIRMITIVLDTNIYDKLDADQAMVEQINQPIADKVIDKLMPRHVAEELRQRPAGIPELFTMTYTDHAVARAGITCAGDYLGSGEVFDDHRGDSQKAADAYIADVASMIADWFVSEDIRCIRRFPANMRCTPMRYQQFHERLTALVRQ